MSSYVLETGRLLAAALILGSTAATAWTPYTHSPYGPGHPSEALPDNATAEEPARGAAASPYPPYGYDYPPFGYGYPPTRPYSGIPPTGTGGFGPGMSPEPPAYPSDPRYPVAPSTETEGYGPAMPPLPPGFAPNDPRGQHYPGLVGPRHGGPSGPLQISRRATQNAYIIEIPVTEISADDLQITTQGNWISIGRKQSQQETREDTFDQGRGFARSYSFSSGSASRRFNVPGDADMQAMTREESDGVLRLVIPRRKH